MSRTLAFLFSLFTLCFSSQGQVKLSEGGTFTYRFDGADLVFSGIGGQTYGSILFQFRSPEAFPTGSVLRYELFEGAPSGVPIFSNVVVAPVPLHVNVSVSVSNAWQDLNGSICLTTVAGTASVSSVMFAIGRPEGLYVASIDPPPPLTIIQASDAVQIRWLTNRATYYGLQSRTDVAGGVWTNVLEPAVVMGSEKVITLPISNTTTRFFHLSQ